MPPQGISTQNMPKWKKLQVEYSQFADFIGSSLSKSDFKKSFIPQVELQRYE